MVEGDQQQRFQQLALDGRAFHRNNGLLGEDGHTFFNGPDVAMQLEIGQVVEELLIKHTGGAEIRNVLVGEFQIIHGFDELLQAGHDGVAAAIRHTTEEHIKDGNLVLIAFIQISGGHRQLVEVRHRRQIAFYIQHGNNPPDGFLHYDLSSLSRLQTPRMDNTHTNA